MLIIMMNLFALQLSKMQRQSLIEKEVSMVDTLLDIYSLSACKSNSFRASFMENSLLPLLSKKRKASTRVSHI
jgi:hypothetical protein